MTVLLVQLDGKLPNLALMRIAAHHRERGDTLVFRRYVRAEQCQPEFGLVPDRVYASSIFARTAPVVAALRTTYPDAVIGGTGVDISTTLPAIGIATQAADYSMYPTWRSSIGFTQRGCRLRCGFCVVPRKEGSVHEEQTVWQIWRGDPYPRELLLLDNDFFGQAGWATAIRAMVDGKFKVSFCQGINARFLTDETAAALAAIDYRDDGMRYKQLYTAWDNRKDEGRLFRGLELLVKHGVKPAHIMVYMLVGYWPGETHEDREHRRRRLRAFGAVPYPMPFVRTPELVRYQRWVVGAYDKAVSWEEWTRAGFYPTGLRRRALDRAQMSLGEFV